MQLSIAHIRISVPLRIVILHAAIAFTILSRSRSFLLSSNFPIHPPEILQM